MPILLEVRHLALVDAIAAAGSVTRAAERLHLTQSALSHQLRDIESRLDLQFFHRLGRRMVLTSAGERALQSARRVLDELARAEDDLRAMANGGGGVLRFCTQCNTGYQWLPPLLREFQAVHPRVDVRIQAEATSRPIAALLAGEIDLAIVTDEVRDRRLHGTKLFKDELVAVVAPSHPWASRRSIQPEAFAAEHLIVYSADRNHSFTFTRVLKPAGVEPARVSQVPLTEAIVELAAAGLGVGVLARWTVGSALASGTVRAVRITPRGVYRTWTAVRVRQQPEPVWMRDFIDRLASSPLPARRAC
ncbi:MAG TPA: LysR substrate-binding domain-containing protein [Vicinamibacterales bacterium]|nr:LysR substrate-binding domain-containing protein [Vicinamibacterales bacterium]